MAGLGRGWGVAFVPHPVMCTQTLGKQVGEYPQLTCQPGLSVGLPSVPEVSSSSFPAITRVPGPGSRILVVSVPNAPTPVVVIKALYNPSSLGLGKGRLSFRMAYSCLPTVATSATDLKRNLAFLRYLYANGSNSINQSIIIKTAPGDFLGAPGRGPGFHPWSAN